MKSLLAKTLFSVVAVLLFTCSSIAQFTDLPGDAVTVDIAVSGDRGSQSHSLTAVVPVKAVEGWAGLYGLQTVVGGQVVSEIGRARIQGGTTAYGVGIQAFVDLERNHVKGTDLTKQVGYFLRFGIHEYGAATLSGGVGNFIEEVTAREDLGLEDEDAVVRWLAFVSVDVWGIDTLIKITPDWSLTDFQITAEPTWSTKLKENLDFRARATIERCSKSLTGRLIETRYESGIQFSF